MNDLLSKKLLCVVVSTVAIGGMGSCGSGESTEFLTSSSDSGASIKPKVMMPDIDPARPGEQGCGRARAKAAPNPHVIRVSARCFSSTPKGAFVSIGLFRPGDPLASPRIIGVSRVLRAVGPRASRPGRCRLFQGNAECSADFKGYARFMATLIVDARARCSVGVSAASFIASPCPERECFDGPKVNLFFRGIPNGCRPGSESFHQ